MKAHHSTVRWCGMLWVCALSGVLALTGGCGKKSPPESKTESAPEAPAAAPAEKADEPAAQPEDQPEEADTGPARLAVTMENVLYADGVQASLTGAGNMTLTLTVKNLREDALRIKLHDALVIHPDPRYQLLRVSVKDLQRGKKKETEKEKKTPLAVKAGETQSVSFKKVAVVRRETSPDQAGHMANQGMHDPAVTPGVGKPKPRGELQTLTPGQVFFGFAAIPKFKPKKRARQEGDGAAPGQPVSKEELAKQAVSEYVALRNQEWLPQAGALGGAARANDATALADHLGKLLKKKATIKIKVRMHGTGKEEERVVKLEDNPYILIEARLRLIRAAMACYPAGLRWMDDEGGQNDFNKVSLSQTWRLVSERELTWALEKRWQRQRARYIQRVVNEKIEALTSADARATLVRLPLQELLHILIRRRQLEQIGQIVSDVDIVPLEGLQKELDRRVSDKFSQWARDGMKQGSYAKVAQLGRQAQGLMADAAAKKRIGTVVAIAGTQAKAKSLYAQALAAAGRERFDQALKLLEDVRKLGETDHLEKAEKKHEELLAQAEALAVQLYEKARQQQLDRNPYTAAKLYGRIAKELSRTQAAKRARDQKKYLEEKFINRAAALLAKANAALGEDDFETVRQSLRTLGVLGKDLPQQKSIPGLNARMDDRIEKLAKQLQSMANRAELLKRHDEALKWWRRILKMKPPAKYSLKAQQRIQVLEEKLGK